MNPGRGKALAVELGCDAETFLKYPAHVVVVAEAAVCGNFLDGQTDIGQQLLGQFETPGLNEFLRALADFLMKYAGEIAHAHHGFCASVVTDRRWSRFSRIQFCNSRIFGRAVFCVSKCVLNCD